MKVQFAWLACLFVCVPAWAHEPNIIHGEDVEPLAFPGHVTRLLSGPDNTESKAAILELVLPSGTFGAPPHVHSKEDEHFYVISGEMQFLDREEIVTGKAGSLVILPRGHLHGFWNASDQEARMLLIVTPGQFASFFDSVVQRIRAENPDSSERVGQLIGELAASYGVTTYPQKTPAAALKLLPR